MSSKQTIEVIDTAGASLRSIEVLPAVFDVAPNHGLAHEVIVGLRANRRQGTHATKTRAFVSGSGKKPFRQKGTGSARRGSNRSPLMRGGAVCHGPNPRNYHRKIPQRIRSQALRVMLSDRFRNGRLIVVDDFKVNEYRTKTIVKMLTAIGASKPLLADDRQDDFLYRSTRNIYRAAVVPVQEINALHVANHESLVISEQALRAIEKRLAPEEVVA